jgi:hypothetical protein
MTIATALRSRLRTTSDAPTRAGVLVPSAADHLVTGHGRWHEPWSPS